jgi:hypothetical protein
MEAMMSDSIPAVELPAFATIREHLASSVEYARRAVSYRLGYEVELAGLEPLDRVGHAHMRVYWRRRPAHLLQRRNQIATLAGAP